MAICGFCKKNVTFVGFGLKEKQELKKKKKGIFEDKIIADDNTIVAEHHIGYSMYSCPHCQSILGVSH